MKLILFNINSLSCNPRKHIFKETNEPLVTLSEHPRYFRTSLLKGQGSALVDVTAGQTILVTFKKVLDY